MLKECGLRHIAKGVRVSVHAPWISHLLFAYDCVIFTQANQRGVDRVAQILEDYYRGSGQMVNKQKSAVFFSANCVEEDKQIVHDSLQIPLEALGERYLSLPTAVGKVSDGVFSYVPDRFRNFICGWSKNLLSYAGREVLIKANALAVPTYSMSCFRLPAPIAKR
jgi:hypothetical protein